MIQLGYGTWLVTRAEWGARRPRSVTALWVDLATSHWEGPHMGAFPHESCASKVRGIQAFHMDSRGWSDIAYNAVACPHGYVFEGRGDGVRSAANGTTAGNSGGYAVCYLGGEGDGFTEAGSRAMKAAGDWLTRAGSGRNGHRDWKPTACPGDEIYHWTHAGQPVTATTPKKEEDDDMPRFTEPYLFQSPKHGIFIVDSGVATWLSNGDQVHEFRTQGLELLVATKSEADAERFLLERANTRDDLTRIEMRLQALQETEAREEQRDLADG